MKLIEFNDRSNITSIAASYSFVHFLTASGNIYSKGANFNGQLGLGRVSSIPVEKPVLNTFLRNKKEIIESVSVGIAHSVVKSKLGYAYVWGDNSFGQVAG